jgi:hypothetical protein
VNEGNVHLKRKESVSKAVEKTAKANAGKFVRVSDFDPTKAVAVMKALSRMSASGELERVSKGVYYVPRSTLLGQSQPAASSVAEKVLKGKSRPIGTSAANLLGLSTQVPARDQIVIYGQAKVDSRVLRPKRRKGSPGATETLANADAAVLEVLRDRGRFSELDDADTVDVLKSVLARLLKLEPQRLRQLVNVALSEPPRARAMLGAFLEEIGATPRFWQPLRDSLNPLSKFDFGAFHGLQTAKRWQAK